MHFLRIYEMIITQIQRFLFQYSHIPQAHLTGGKNVRPN